MALVRPVPQVEADVFGKILGMPSVRQMENVENVN
jgi:hypothetical protein